MKINTTHTEKLQAALDTVQSRAKIRTTDAEDVQRLVKRVEARLGGLLCKKDWRGFRFTLDPNAQGFPRSYFGTPESTKVIIERGSRDWFVTQVMREWCAENRVVPASFGTSGCVGDMIVSFLWSPTRW